MDACPRYREDQQHSANLALLAGGDLSPEAVDGVRSHVASCGACRGLLRELESDQAIYRSMVQARSLGPSRLETAEPSLAGAVLGRLAAQEQLATAAPAKAGTRETHEGTGSSGPTLAGRAGTGFARPRGLPRWAEAAAVILVVGGAIGLTVARDAGREDSLPGDAPAGEAGSTQERALASDGEVQVASLGPAQAGLPLQVRRSPGGAVELTWEGDGRQAAPYTVLSSPSAGDFTQARVIAVDGENLVSAVDAGAGASASGGATAERQVTFYRVE